MDFLGAILGGIGGIIGAGAQDSAAEKNWQINLLNYYQRERERKEAMRLAQEVRDENKLGSTDSRGNRTHFVPGQGWVAELSSQGQEMQNAQDREQLAVLQHDLPQQRKIADRNYARQLDEDFIAQAFLNAMKRGNPELTSQTQARYRAAAVQGLNENWDNLENETAKKALRSGSSNIGNIMMALARGRMKASDDSVLRANMAGEEAHGSMTADPKLANIYSMFATRASQNPRVPYQPQQLSEGNDNMMRAFAAAQGGRDNAAIAATGKQGGTMDYIQPNYGWANAISGFGSALEGASDKADSRKRYTDMLNRYYGGATNNAGF